MPPRPRRRQGQVGDVVMGLHEIAERWDDLWQYVAAIATGQNT